MIDEDDDFAGSDEDDIGGHDDADHADVDTRGRFESEDDDIDQAGGYQE